MIICRVCGAVSNPGVRLCTRCGSELTDSSPKQGAPGMPVPAQVVVGAQSAPSPVVAGARNPGSLLQIGASVGALFLFVLIAWLINSDRPNLSTLLSGRSQTGGHARDSSLLRLGTGDVQITLRWQGDVDLDLHVVDPRGDRVWFAERSSGSGGQLDVDANAACSPSEMMNNPVENVYWAVGAAPRGQYQIIVNYYADCTGQGPTSYKVDVKVDGRTDTYSGTMNYVGEMQDVHEFDR